MQEGYFSIFLIFLRFGLLAWGGPVAQIAMIREEMVDRRAWITPEKFRRVLALYQALPGPEAHELCVYFGMVRAGRIGGFLAGLGFMLPGLLLILLLAWGYRYYGAASVVPLFVGVAPAVAALITRAAHRISMHTLTGQSHLVAAIVAILMTLMGAHFLLVFVVCALWQVMWDAGYHRVAMIGGAVLAPCAVAVSVYLLSLGGQGGAGSGHLLMEGLKAGLLSFGGAYTAIPFLQHSMVGHYPEVTPQVFLDSIALGSVIPAPLIIFGTFLGYIADGIAGAVWMTLGIFVPAFSFTLLGHHQLERIIAYQPMHSFLDGVSAAVTGLLVLTALQIGLLVVTGWPQALLFVFALIGFYRVSGKWVVPVVISACGVIGWWLVPLATGGF